MKKKFDRELTLEELAALPDDHIDYSDIPPLDENFWKNARIVEPATKPNISLRLSEDVIDFFKRENPRGYTSKMAAVLSAYVRAHKGDGGVR